MPPSRLKSLVLHPPERSEALLFLSLAIGLFALALWRTFKVPLTQDEVNNFFEFVLPFHIDLFSPPYSANNHLLNTLLTGIFVKLFGTDQWVLRLVNLFSFPLFAFGIWKLGTNLRPLARWALIFALLGNYFMFEFFSFSRGYGLSMALIVLHFGSMWAYLKVPSNQHLVRSILFLMLALAANLTLLTYSMLVFLFIALDTILRQRWKPAQLLSIATLLIWIVLAATAALRLQVKGELYWGSQRGFIETTVLSLLNNFRLNTQGWQLWILAVLFLISLYPLSRIFKHPVRVLLTKPPFVLSIMMLALCIAPILLNAVLGVNYPYERAALYFVPAFWLTVVLASDSIGNKRIRVAIAGFVCIAALYFPIDFVRHFDVDYSRAEPYGNLPQKLYHQVMEDAELHSIKVPIVELDGAKRYVWSYMDFMDTEHSSVSLVKPISADYKIVGEPLQSGQLLAEQSLPGHRLLLFRVYRNEAILKDTTFYKTEIEIRDEYVSITGLDSMDLEDGFWEHEISFQVEGLNKDTRIHLASEWGADPANYSLIPFKRSVNVLLKENTFHTKLQMLSDDESSPLKIYVWNPKSERVLLRNIKVRSRRLDR